jgi:hypothetical protein
MRNKLFKFIGIVVERRFSYNNVQTIKDGKFKPAKDAEELNEFSAESIGVGVVEPAKNVLSLLKLFEMSLNDHK